MYIDYSKLWKLLIDKEISKTDLMELTGISSRVLAKLSKNETVTTDTIARICTALECDVSDIMECVSENRLSVYAAYKKFGVVTEETEQYETVRFAIGDQKYVIYRTKKAATKSVHVECGGNGTVYLKQLYAVGYILCDPEVSIFIQPKGKPDEITIVLIKGKPGVIKGLDENGFVSSRGIRRSPTDVYVMSEAAFKVFSPRSV